MSWFETLKGIGAAAAKNAGFVIFFILIIAAIIAISKFSENLINKKNGYNTNERGGRTRKLCAMALMAAMSVILMLFEIPLPFLPSFYKIDFSELPIIIGAFAYGPVAGVTIEAVKIFLNLVINGTSTAFVGEFANFALGCIYVVPASIMYYYKKTRKNAIIGLSISTVLTAVGGCFFNAFLLLPAYAQAFHMPVDTLVAMGTAVNSNITSLFTFVVLAVAPFNIIKYGAVSIITVLVYKYISKLLKTTYVTGSTKKKEAVTAK